jgi:hypothetical protein
MPHKKFTATGYKVMPLHFAYQDPWYLESSTRTQVGRLPCGIQKKLDVANIYFIILGSMLRE